MMNQPEQVHLSTDVIREAIVAIHKPKPTFRLGFVQSENGPSGETLFRVAYEFDDASVVRLSGSEFFLTCDQEIPAVNAIHSSGPGLDGISRFDEATVIPGETFTIDIGNVIQS